MGFRLLAFLPHPLIYMLLETNDRARKGVRLKMILEIGTSFSSRGGGGGVKINPPLYKKERKQWFVGAPAVIRSEEAR